MATKLVRAKGVLDSLLDGDVGNPLAARVGDAFAIYSQLQSPTPIDISTLTAVQKADIFLIAVRQYIKGVVQQAEVSAAVKTTVATVTPTTVIDLGV